MKPETATSKKVEGAEKSSTSANKDGQEERRAKKGNAPAKFFFSDGIRKIVMVTGGGNLW